MNNTFKENVTVINTCASVDRGTVLQDVALTGHEDLVLIVFLVILKCSVQIMDYSLSMNPSNNHAYFANANAVPAHVAFAFLKP